MPELNQGDPERVLPVPLWHFVFMTAAYLAIVFGRPGSLRFTHLGDTTPRLFGSLILLQILLAASAIWGFRLVGNRYWPFSRENSLPESLVGDIWRGIALGVGLIVCSILIELAFPGGRKNMAPALAKTPLDHALELALYIVGSICEEIQYRAYFLRQFLAITRNAGFAVVLQAVLFVLMHGLDQGLSGYLTRFIIGMAFGMVAVARNSLWPSITAHLLINGMAFTAGLS